MEWSTSAYVVHSLGVDVVAMLEVRDGWAIHAEADLDLRAAGCGEDDARSTVVSVPAGLWIFNQAERFAKRTGRLKRNG